MRRVYWDYAFSIIIYKSIFIAIKYSKKEGAPAQDEAKGLIKCISIISFSSIVRESLDKIVEFLTLIKFMFCLVL